MTWSRIDHRHPDPGRDLAGYVNLCRHRGSQLSDAAGKPSQTHLGPTGTFWRLDPMSVSRLDVQLRWQAAGGTFPRRSGRSREGGSSAPSRGGGDVGWFRLGTSGSGSGWPIGDQFQESETYLSNYPLSDLRTAVRIVYPIAANWKALVENYNECYHCGPVHPELVELVPAFRQRGGSELDWASGIPHREGAWTFTASGTSNRQPFPG